MSAEREIAPDEPLWQGWRSVEVDGDGLDRRFHPSCCGHWQRTSLDYQGQQLVLGNNDTSPTSKEGFRFHVCFKISWGTTKYKE